MVQSATGMNAKLYTQLPECVQLYNYINYIHEKSHEIHEKSLQAILKYESKARMDHNTVNYELLTNIMHYKCECRKGAPIEDTSLFTNVHCLHTVEFVIMDIQGVNSTKLRGKKAKMS